VEGPPQAAVVATLRLRMIVFHIMPALTLAPKMRDPSNIHSRSSNGIDRDAQNALRYAERFYSSQYIHLRKNNGTSA